jgi:hypothetical protein
MIRFGCPKCKQVLQCPPSSAGQVVACGSCKTPLRVPAAPAAPAAPPPLPPPPVRDDPVDVLPSDPLPPPPPPPPAPPPPTRDVENPFALGPDGRAPIELPDNLPPEAAQLGPPTRQFPHKHGRTTAVIGGVCIGAGLLGVFLGVVFLIVSAGSTRGGRSSDSGFPFIIIIAGLVFVGAGVWNLVRGLRGMKTRVLVCDGGLIDCRPSRIDVCPWDEVDGFWRQVTDTRVYMNGVYQGTRRTHLFRVRMRDGRRLSFDDHYPQVGQLGPHIEEEVNRRRMPAILADLKAGRAVDFDAAVVSPHGLEVRGDRIAWNQIDFIELIQGTVFIRELYRIEPWAKVPVPQIANVFIFLNVVQSLSGKVRT